MIDLTTIQTFPVPEEIGNLQNKLSNVVEENKKLRKVMIIFIIVFAAYGSFRLYKTYKKNVFDKSKNT